MLFRHGLINNQLLKMTINRNNYESFFLLYIDNELSDAEKKTVELFVGQNADLQPEFDAIKKTILQPELIHLENKNELLKKEIYNPVQENLLLLLDDELAQTQKKGIENLIANNFTIATEWGILQQTKLLPDTTIVFKNKSTLYKKETATVIKMYWKKRAIAAILLGFGAWAGVKYYNSPKKYVGIEFAKNNFLQNKTVTTNTNISPSNTIVVNKNATPSSLSKSIAQTNKPTSSKKEIIQNNNLPYLQNINNKKSNIIVTASVLPTQPDLQLAVNVTPSINNKTDIIKDDIVAADKNAYTVNAAYDWDEKSSDNKILYFDEEKVKRTKLGGLFRKVKRVFERTADIKTGETLKIAGFEIAVR
jgi:hypothetical protein